MEKKKIYARAFFFLSFFYDFFQTHFAYFFSTPQIHPMITLPPTKEKKEQKTKIKRKKSFLNFNQTNTKVAIRHVCIFCNFTLVLCFFLWCQKESKKKRERERRKKNMWRMKKLFFVALQFFAKFNKNDKML